MQSADESFPSWLPEYVDRIDSEISSLYAKHGSQLDAAVLYALSAKGKRIRAVLSLLWCEAACGDYRRAIPVAVAYELAHVAALVQDDIIDRSETRRGEPSIVKKYGVSGGILVSNMLMFQVPKKIAEYERFNVSVSTLCRLFEMLGESYGASTRGEFLDLEMARLNDLSVEDYEEMIRLKTGALIAAASASGAIVGTDSQNVKMIESAHRFGELLGMAYQIQDDVLDLMGNEQNLGKPVFTDMQSGKRNIVLIHTLKNCSDAERQFVTGLFGNSGHYSQSDIERARELFARYGSLDRAKQMAEGYVRESVGILVSLKESNARTKLGELVEFLSKRKY